MVRLGLCWSVVEGLQGRESGGVEGMPTWSRGAQEHCLDVFSAVLRKYPPIVVLGFSMCNRIEHMQIFGPWESTGGDRMASQYCAVRRSLPTLRWDDLIFLPAQMFRWGANHPPTCLRNRG